MKRFAVVACDDEGVRTWDVYDRLRKQTAAQLIPTRARARELAFDLEVLGRPNVREVLKPCPCGEVHVHR